MGEAGSTALVRCFDGMVGSEGLLSTGASVWLVSWPFIFVNGGNRRSGPLWYGPSAVGIRTVPCRMLWVRHGTYLILYLYLDATRCVVFSLNAGAYLVGL